MTFCKQMLSCNVKSQHTCFDWQSITLSVVKCTGIVCDFALACSERNVGSCSGAVYGNFNALTLHCARLNGVSVHHARRPPAAGLAETARHRAVCRPGMNKNPATRVHDPGGVRLLGGIRAAARFDAVDSSQLIT